MSAKHTRLSHRTHGVRQVRRRRHLARLLRFAFHDSDADIESKTGVDIAFIFEKEGEGGLSACGSANPSTA